MSAAGLLLLGVGETARQVAALATGRSVVATTRQESRAQALREEGFDPLVASPLTADALSGVIGPGTWVLVSFPPDGVTDAAIAPTCAGAASIVYVSSTAVYGALSGVIDETSPVAPDDARGERRLEAERHWQKAGATVLRAPGIYGPGFGLRARLAAGSFRVPGEGANRVSRIHVADLARLAVAALSRDVRAETFVVGDLAPASLAEVTGYLCATYALPSPPSIPVAEAHPSLTHDRAVDPRHALQTLGVELAYPSYREGFADG